MSDFSRSIRSASARTSRPNSARSNSSSIMNIQKREKLRSLLIEKFLKKFPNNSNRNFIIDEVDKFIKNEKLTEIDLKNLEKRLSDIINNNENINNYSNFNNENVSRFSEKTGNSNLNSNNSNNLNNLN